MTLEELLDKTCKNEVYLYDKKINDVQDWFTYEELSREQLNSEVIDWEITYKGYLHAEI